ncbi:isochorismatase family protein [Shewanella sp. A3A]|nr:isochorismatase family protein [Shewanella ferrihydritica]
MPVTQLDAKTALIVIDLQHGIVQLPLCHPVQPVIDQCVSLINAFRAKQQPVVLVNVDAAPAGRTDLGVGGKYSDEFAKLLPELNVQASDILITKSNWGAFINTDLHQQLQAQGVTQVVVVGIATAIGVESTARQAFELGYHVTIAVDAITDLNIDTHNNSVQRIFPKLGETGTTAEVLQLLQA